MLYFQLDGETEFEKKAREGMGDDEAQFSVEVALDQQAFLWSDKYRPRKPRFFNRVHTVSAHDIIYFLLSGLTYFFILSASLKFCIFLIIWGGKKKNKLKLHGNN